MRVLRITSGFVTTSESVLAELHTWAFRILREATSVAGQRQVGQTRRTVCSLCPKGQRTSAFNGNGPGGCITTIRCSLCSQYLVYTHDLYAKQTWYKWGFVYGLRRTRFYQHKRCTGMAGSIPRCIIRDTTNGTTCSTTRHI